MRRGRRGGMEGIVQLEAFGVKMKCVRIHRKDVLGKADTIKAYYFFDTFRARFCSFFPSPPRHVVSPKNVNKTERTSIFPMKNNFTIFFFFIWRAPSNSLLHSPLPLPLPQYSFSAFFFLPSWFPLSADPAFETKSFHSSYRAIFDAAKILLPSRILSLIRG